MLRSSLLACFVLSKALHAQTAWPDQVVCPPDLVTSYQPLAGHGFGSSIEVDGNRMLVGAPEDQSNSPKRGSVYVYERSAAEMPWVLVAKLFPSPPPGPSNITDYGRSMASDGALVAVGAPSSALIGSSYTGFVEVWLRAPFGWYISLGQIAPPEPAQGSQPTSLFGSQLEFDSSRLLIAAPLAINPTVFEYQVGPMGGWWLTQVIRPSSMPSAYFFGTSMDLDQGRLAVGSQPTPFPLQTPGAVFLFERDSLGNWVEVHRFDPPCFAAYGFAYAIDLQADRLVVGYCVSPQNMVSAVVYERDSFGVWSTGALLHHPAAFGSGFHATAVAVDGDTAIVSANAGLALFERLAPGDWRLKYEVASGHSMSSPLPYWSAIELDGTRVIAGSGGLDVCNSGTARRGAYIGFDRASLLHGNPATSISSSGTQDLLLDFGLAGAGRFYFMLGSVSGTSPGIALPNSSDTLPLVFDAYTSTLLDRPTLTITNGWGVLDELGRADAQFRVPNGLDPSFAGLVLHHAAVTLDPVSGALAASNAVAVELVP